MLSARYFCDVKYILPSAFTKHCKTFCDYKNTLELIFNHYYEVKKLISCYLEYYIYAQSSIFNSGKSYTPETHTNDHSLKLKNNIVCDKTRNSDMLQKNGLHPSYVFIVSLPTQILQIKVICPIVNILPRTFRWRQKWLQKCRRTFSQWRSQQVWLVRLDQKF